MQLKPNCSGDCLEHGRPTSLAFRAYFVSFMLIWVCHLPFLIGSVASVSDWSGGIRLFRPSSLRSQPTLHKPADYVPGAGQLTLPLLNHRLCSSHVQTQRLVAVQHFKNVFTPKINRHMK